MTEMLEKKLRMDAKRKGMPAERIDAFVLDRMAKRFGWTSKEQEKYKETMKK